jgi:hypothetical protein
MFVVTRTDMVDYHRRYALDPLIKTKQQLQFIEILKNRVRATVEEACPECKHPQMEYYTMQLRSADEGQVGGCRRAGRRAGWPADRRGSGWQMGWAALAAALPLLGRCACCRALTMCLPACLCRVPSSPLSLTPAADCVL